MSILPKIDDYSTEELHYAESYSPALRHYLQLLRTPASSFLAKLRHERNLAWCECVLATLFRRETTANICRYWSSVADRVTMAAWDHSGCSKKGLALFALGKWGSHELNLSSDIDIMIVSENPPDSETLRCVREFISQLSVSDEHGFCFRVDADLRPGGRLSPIVISAKQLEDYYWTLGSTWERLALVRLRPVVGPFSLTSFVASMAEKFAFRRYIDYGLLEDLKHLRSQIHGHYPQTERDQVNLKLAPGGIRDIELFIHSLQVIHGGKNKSLRTSSTSSAADELVGARRFDQKNMQFLIESYWEFRDLENRVQAKDDLQSHVWRSRDGTTELERFFKISRQVEEIVESLLGQPSREPLLPKEDSDLKKWLEELGYSERTITQHIPDLLSLTALSARTFSEEEQRLRILRQFIETLSRVALDKNLGIALLVDFFRAIRVKTSFFSLLAHEKKLIHDLCVLFGCSPYLGGILSARPELLDGYVFRLQASSSRSIDDILEELAERKLLSEIVTANQFLQNRDLSALHQSLTSTADEICTDLLQLLNQNHTPARVEILALGKWGGRELGLRSDLDFIFITDGPPTENEQKVARRFLSRMTEQHRGGAIFDVDMRLRPSGKAGPLIVDRFSLLDYLTNKAAPWERQSYLKARNLRSRSVSDAEIHEACLRQPLGPAEVKELQRIRQHLLKVSSSGVDIKHSPGGLMDIEFTAQIGLLQKKLFMAETETENMLLLLSENDHEWHAGLKNLTEHYRYFRLIEQLHHLVNQHPGTQLDFDSDGFRRVAQILRTDMSALASELQSRLGDSLSILKTVDPRQSQS